VDGYEKKNRFTSIGTVGRTKMFMAASQTWTMGEKMIDFLACTANSATT
jgi:hypothetical protein